jgi:hypothetical protein
VRSSITGYEVRSQYRKKGRSERRYPKPFIRKRTVWRDATCLYYSTEHPIWIPSTADFCELLVSEESRLFGCGLWMFRILLLSLLLSVTLLYLFSVFVWNSKLMWSSLSVSSEVPEDKKTTQTWCTHSLFSLLNTTFRTSNSASKQGISTFLYYYNPVSLLFLISYNLLHLSLSSPSTPQ